MAACLVLPRPVPDRTSSIARAPSRRERRHAGPGRLAETASRSGWPTRAELATIRAALVARINTAAEKAKWGRNPESEGMPHRLFAVGCYLARHGFDGPLCDGERWFNVNFIYYATLACPENVEDGRRRIHDRRDPLLTVQPMRVAA